MSNDNQNVVSIASARPTKKDPNVDAIELVEGLLERLKSGDAVAVAFAEVHADGSVATAWCKSSYYHHLNSGAATLAARIAIS